MKTAKLVMTFPVWKLPWIALVDAKVEAHFVLHNMHSVCDSIRWNAHEIDLALAALQPTYCKHTVRATACQASLPGFGTAARATTAAAPAMRSRGSISSSADDKQASSTSIAFASSVSGSDRVARALQAGSNKKATTNRFLPRRSVQPASMRLRKGPHGLRPYTHPGRTATARRL